MEIQVNLKAPNKDEDVLMMFKDADNEYSSFKV